MSLPFYLPLLQSPKFSCMNALHLFFAPQFDCIFLPHSNRLHAAIRPPIFTFFSISDLLSQSLFNEVEARGIFCISVGQCSSAALGMVDSSTVAWALRRPSLTLRNLASPVAESVLLVLLVLHARKTSFSRLVIFFLFSRLHDISEIRGSKTSK